jgi:hypothetical protein
MDTSIRDTEGRAPLYLYYEHCYGPFVDREDARRLYEKYPRSESCFRGVDRIKLLMSILSAPTRDGGAGLPLDKLVRRKACDAAFPLHEEDELKSLEARWIRMWARPAQLPSERVRSYFGEKIAFYYLFLAHATTYFSYAAVIGFAVFLNTLISPEAENAASVPYFCARGAASVASPSRRPRDLASMARVLASTPPPRRRRRRASRIVAESADARQTQVHGPLGHVLHRDLEAQGVEARHGVGHDRV